jgi:F0F1-type ATP synthase assembly protein I
MVNPQPPPHNRGQMYAQAAGIGFTFVFIFAAFGIGGFILDDVLGTLPLFLFVGLGVGFFGGMYLVYLTLKKLGRRR